MLNKLTLNTKYNSSTLYD